MSTTLMGKGPFGGGHQRNTSAGQQLIVTEERCVEEDEVHTVQPSYGYGAASPSHPMPNLQDTSRTAFTRASNSSSELAITRAEQITNNYMNNTNNKKCCENPKIRENAKVVIASVLLTMVGAVLLIIGVVLMIYPAGLTGWVFLFAGFLFFTPGIYHVVYILCTLSGRPGYTFDNLPTFSR